MYAPRRQHIVGSRWRTIPADIILKILDFMVMSEVIDKPPFEESDGPSWPSSKLSFKTKNHASKSVLTLRATSRHWRDAALSSLHKPKVATIEIELTSPVPEGDTALATDFATGMAAIGDCDIEATVEVGAHWKREHIDLVLKSIAPRVRLLYLIQLPYLLPDEEPDAIPLLRRDYRFPKLFHLSLMRCDPKTVIYPEQFPRLASLQAVRGDVNFLSPTNSPTLLAQFPHVIERLDWRFVNTLVKLNLDQTHCSALLSQGTLFCFPLLEELRVPRIRLSHLQGILVLIQAPKLTSLSLQLRDDAYKPSSGDENCSIAPGTSLRSYPKIATLSLGGFGIWDAFRLCNLASCPNLQSLQLRFLPSIDEVHSAGPQICLATHIALSWKARTISQIKNLFANLALPRIESIDVEGRLSPILFQEILPAVYDLYRAFPGLRRSSIDWAQNQRATSEDGVFQKIITTYDPLRGHFTAPVKAIQVEVPNYNITTGNGVVENVGWTFPMIETLTLRGFGNHYPTALRTICIGQSEQPLDKSLGALSMMKTLVSHHSDRVPLPDLKRIVMYGYGTTWWSYDWQKATISTAILAVLKDVVQQRRKTKSPLQEVRCSMPLPDPENDGKWFKSRGVTYTVIPFTYA